MEKSRSGFDGLCPLAIAATLVCSCYAALAGTPVPTYGTYFGGTGDTNVAVAVAVDPQGNVIVAGYTTSQTLPGTANAFQPTKAIGFPNNQDVFVAKFDPTGRSLLWTTFLGGDGDEVPVALAVDSAGNIYVTGTTQSSNFPASRSISCVPVSGFVFLVAFQQSCSMQSATNAASGFLSKLSSDGHTLLYSIGFGNVQGPMMRPTALTIDDQGEAFVGAVGPGGSAGLFLFRANVSGTGLIYGIFLGGGDISFQGNITALVVDSQGNCYVAGSATINVPTTPNALQTSNSNANLSPNPGNGFILEVNPDGSHLIYGTWFGPRYFG